ncbi:inorganic phosphate transporter [Brachybacterium endophyticum]|uniref:Inorganic phosphate transporter n=1 Tax=Brachybacterium endophyticum TaxID=2182385 RepID=A0A2U2RKM1_9MICO|nr:inorganic phosphate transporter [Brachybacterium endophyticum]PWH06386.1 inorganic phosphate transporter [Brachybacterium endophyticum]
MVSSFFVVAVVLALAFAYVNGFHDASNAVSTTIATRAMSERSSLVLAAVLNLLGSLLGLGLSLAGTHWALDLAGLNSFSDVPMQGEPLLPPMLAGIVLAVIAWSLATWALGMPSSTWQAMLGAAAGAALSLGLAVPWASALPLVLAPMLTALLVGGAGSYLLARVIRRLGADDRIGIGSLQFLQTLSAGAVATAHGFADSRIAMGVIVLAASYEGVDLSRSAGAIVAMVGVSLALAAGTLVGGRRIIRTLARRLTNLATVQGFAAETVTALIVILGASFSAPSVSTSHSLTSSVVGSGLALGPRQIRWNVFGGIVGVWVVTPLASLGLGAVFTLLVQRLTT